MEETVEDGMRLRRNAKPRNVRKTGSIRDGRAASFYTRSRSSNPATLVSR